MTRREQREGGEGGREKQEGERDIGILVCMYVFWCL